jgi:hypothetical protein
MHRARLALFTLLALLPRVGSAGPAETRAFVVTTDFATGGLSAATLATRAVQTDVASVHADATLRWAGGKVYVVNRFGQDNIQVVDPAQGFATVRQFSTGNGSNPQDIVVVSPTRAYVSCLGLASLLIVDPAAGTVVGSIPLAPFADADGVPEAARMTRAGGHLFVALQRLVNFAPADTSIVAVVDLAADTLLDVDPRRPGVQGIPLVGRNPVTTFDYDPFGDRLLVGCAGAYGALDGGIEAIPLCTPCDVIDPTRPRWASAGFVATEQALGGDVGDIAFLLPGHSFAIVSDAAFNTAVVAWSALTGQRTGTVWSPGGFELTDLAVSPARDELWVCRGGFAAPGLYVFRCGDHAALAGPLSTGLPPYQIVFDRDDATLIAPTAEAPRTPAPAGGLALAPPWPNPARAGVTLMLRDPAGGEAIVEVTDVAGRRVRTWSIGAAPAGERRIAWDLRDEVGNPAPPGVYVVRARSGGMFTSRQIVVTR